MYSSSDRAAKQYKEFIADDKNKKGLIIIFIYVYLTNYHGLMVT